MSFFNKRAPKNIKEFYWRRCPVHYQHNQLSASQCTGSPCYNCGSQQMAREYHSSWRFIHRCACLFESMFVSTMWGKVREKLERWGDAFVIMYEWVYNVSIQAVNLPYVAVFKCVYASLSMHYLLHYCCVSNTDNETQCGCVSSSLSHSDPGLTDSNLHIPFALWPWCIYSTFKEIFAKIGHFVRLKGIVHPKIIFTLMWFKTSMWLFLLLNTKEDIFRNVQSVVLSPSV